MAKIRRSKTNTTHFMDIPKNGENKIFKIQNQEDDKDGIYN
jgi:hypothetical protein